MKESMHARSFLTPKATVSESMGGKGVFATGPIAKGELVADFSAGTGRMVGTEEADELYGRGFDYMIQVDDDRFFAATTGDELEEGDFLNHSCDPNLGIQGSLRLVAMRDIGKGEELTFDYAMSESSDYRMDCSCGSRRCRKVVTGDDWKIPDLQERYDGFFSDYLQRKIRR